MLITRTAVILVVVTDDHLRSTIARMVAGRGYDVLTAAHAGHAVLASLELPRVDVALIELAMADVSGLTVAARLRRRNPGLQAIYLAPPGTPACDGVLVRPFSADDLLERLSSTLAINPLAS